MAKKSANTPKASKPAGKAAKGAASASSKDGQKVTRKPTATRTEIRNQNPQRQGHSK